MTCRDCQSAESRAPNVCGPMDRNCKGCQARRIANSMAALRALEGDASEMKAEISAVWKDDYETGRAAVIEWMKRIKEWRVKNLPTGYQSTKEQP